VVTDWVAKEGELILLPELAELVGPGVLTFWLIIMVTMPLGVTRAVMFSPIPVLTLETPDVTDPSALTVELDWVGTVAPTLIEAGILSVAMTEGEEIILELPSDSIKLTTPESARLLPTSIAADRLTPPETGAAASPPNNEAAVVVIAVGPVDPVDPESDCNAAETSLEKACCKSIE
jgi:hypothetical protein